VVAAICEDDKQQLDIIKCLLDKYDGIRPGLQLSHHSFLSADDLLSALDDGQHFDLYLLDILMPELSGIDLAAELRTRGVEAPLIFITASADHALDAFGVSAMQYLLKPIKEEPLFSVLDKVIAFTLNRDKEEKLLIIMAPGETIKAPCSSIVCVENYKRLLRVYLNDGTQLYSKTFRGAFESAIAPLFEDARFLQVHKSYVINMKHVERLSDSAFVMSNGMAVHVPRYKLAAMRTRYFDYLSERGSIVPE
jgi:DNA-binding LytR/AlgR family response regulator